MVALVVVFLPAALLLCVLGIDWWMEFSTQEQIHQQVSEVPKRQVALVLGAKVYPDGRLSTMLEDRVRAGVELYKAGRVEKLLMSGDNSESHYDEVTAMRERAIALGVPSDDVVRDFAGFRTWDSLMRARELWSLKDLVVVSQQFHLPRAVYIAHGLGLEADGFIADRPEGYWRAGRRSRLREIPARTLAWLEVHILQPEPHFLGEKEGLSGNAQRDEPPQRNNTRKP